jgi:DNA mismatch repair protein MutS2
MSNYHNIKTLKLVRYSKYMKKELISFIHENNLSPFQEPENLKSLDEKIFKTKDAKAVYSKVIGKLSSNFVFPSTSEIINFFPISTSKEVIEKRQVFLKSIESGLDNSGLKKLKSPKTSWKPKYSLIVVTENEKTLTQLKTLGIPSFFIVTQNDISSLEDYDLVQVLDCEDFSRALESLPNTVFLDSIDQAYLERHLRTLSGWLENLSVLSEINNSEIKSIVSELQSFNPLLENKISNHISREQVEKALEKINSEVSTFLKNMTVSGEVLLSVLSNKSFPPELNSAIKKSIESSGLPAPLFALQIPVKIDEEEFEKISKKQQAKEHTSLSEEVKKHSNKIIQIPKKLSLLSDLILYYDFVCGISKFKSYCPVFPVYSESLSFNNSMNLFLDTAQPISFHLDAQNRCSILTGANSGGKTTLLEHLIQLLVLFQLGLSVSGTVSLPIFSEIYYFAKNKGSTNKGAFETLLTQMSKIKPGKQTLVLADEIESVTEPGVAGRIISATAQYFISKGCFLVVATHLGQQIQKNLPEYARIDGIEAKGLDEYFELIVDHNPVLGRIANSTPELIVEKMANSNKEEYFTFIRDYLKKN